jgi:ubiquinone/menaquinone biosynthesis C-methylase UbiE
MRQKNFHREFFNNRAPHWDSSEDTDRAMKIKKIFHDYRLHPKGRILDIGCGTGIMIPIISALTNDSNCLVELDFSEVMLRQNKAKQNGNFSFSLSFTNADTSILPFSDESFQWIIAFAVLPHLPDKQKVLRELYRVLDSRGTLLILHLMSSHQLNKFHSTVDDVIARDHLPIAADMAIILKKIGFRVKTAIDREELYLILATKSEI